MAICRCCKTILKDDVLLKLNNMPKSAQFFPNASEIDTENGIDIELFQCGSCGLVQAIGEPVPYYRDVIRATGVSREMAEFRKNQFKAFVDEYDLSGKRIIEIGAGCGEHLQYMELYCNEVYGLEHLESSVLKGRDDSHKMIEGFIEDEAYVIDESGFDAFYILNFLEHIPDPAGFLRGICNNLNEDAVGIVEVPNFDMMIEEDLYSEFIQDHLSYFTSDTLVNVLNNNGFEVLSVNSIWHNYIISAVVKKRKRLDLTSMIKQKAKLTKEVESFLVGCKKDDKRVAIWGAGHQALANMSLLHMDKYVSLVVDSADFKQNLYTPATHIKIVSPKELYDYNISMVVIMAGSYSEEIGRIMDKDYSDIDWVILGSDGLNDGNNK